MKNTKHKHKTLKISILAALLSGCDIGAEEEETQGLDDTAPSIEALTEEAVKALIEESFSMDLSNTVQTDSSEQIASSASTEMKAQQGIERITRIPLNSLLQYRSPSINDLPPLTLEEVNEIKGIQNQADTKTMAAASDYYSIKMPTSGVLFNYITESVIPCSTSGTKTVRIVDFNTNGELDMRGEYGEEVYDNCNEADAIIDGRLAIRLIEDPTESDRSGVYEHLANRYEYNDFRIGDLFNIITYNGYFTGQTINYNKHHVTRYVEGSGSDGFHMTDRYGNHYSLYDYTFHREWFDSDWGEAEWLEMIQMPTLESIRDIDLIPPYSNHLTDEQMAADPSEIADTFIFIQTYSYTSSDVLNGEERISVSTMEDIKGDLREHPTEGQVFISTPNSVTEVNMLPTQINIRWGVSHYENDEFYDWDDFNALARSISD